jgi:hypothetical protein
MAVLRDSQSECRKDATTLRPNGKVSIRITCPERATDVSPGQAQRQCRAAPAWADIGRPVGPQYIDRLGRNMPASGPNTAAVSGRRSRKKRWYQRYAKTKFNRGENLQSLAELMEARRLNQVAPSASRARCLATRGSRTKLRNRPLANEKQSHAGSCRELLRDIVGLPEERETPHILADSIPRNHF